MSAAMLVSSFPVPGRRSDAQGHGSTDPVGEHCKFARMKMVRVAFIFALTSHRDYCRPRSRHRRGGFGIAWTCNFAKTGADAAAIGGRPQTETSSYQSEAKAVAAQYGLVDGVRRRVTVHGR